MKENACRSLIHLHLILLQTLPRGSLESYSNVALFKKRWEFLGNVSVLNWISLLRSPGLYWSSARNTLFLPHTSVPRNHCFLTSHLRVKICICNCLKFRFYKDISPETAMGVSVPWILCAEPATSTFLLMVGTFSTFTAPCQSLSRISVLCPYWGFQWGLHPVQFLLGRNNFQIESKLNGISLDSRVNAYGNLTDTVKMPLRGVYQCSPKMWRVPVSSQPHQQRQKSLFPVGISVSCSIFTWQPPCKLHHLFRCWPLLSDALFLFNLIQRIELRTHFETSSHKYKITELATLLWYL